jgi:hypothetical protein
MAVRDPLHISLSPRRIHTKMGTSWIVAALLLFASDLLPESRERMLTPLSIDHVTICGADLDAMRQAFANVGLRTEYGGAHTGSPTHMAQLGFSDGSFVELIAPLEPHQPLPVTAPWPKEMEGNAGPCGWTINVRGIEAQAEQFRGRGIEASTPAPGGRMRLDHVELRWETTALASGSDPRLPFLIEDHTPHDLRSQLAATASSTELTGIAVVVLGVRDLKASTAVLQQAFELSAPIVQRDDALGAMVAYFPGAPVALAAPLSDDSWLAERIRRFGERPAALLIGTLDFRVSSSRFHLLGAGQLAGRKMGWMDAARLNGVRLGIITP